MLILEKVSAGYEGTDVIHNISFSLEAGENLCILGENGCGKTTLLKSIGGIIPSKGTIHIDNQNITKMKRKDIAKKMAVMSQISNIYFSYTIFETVILGRYIHQGSNSIKGVSKKDKEYALDCIRAVGLEELKDKQINTLSGGQLQRVYLARTLAQEPEIILLDEPTNHLDLKHQAGLIDFLKRWSIENKRSVIGVLHDINLAIRLADNILLLKEGQMIAYGKTKEVLTKDRMNKVYDMDVVGYMKNSLINWENLEL